MGACNGVSRPRAHGQAPYVSVSTSFHGERGDIMRPSLSVVVTLLVGAPYAGAQLPERRLPARPAAFAEEPFSELRSVRELSDGRVIVLDMRDQTIQVIDFTSGDAAAIGRRGQGPGEYARAVSLM